MIVEIIAGAAAAGSCGGGSWRLLYLRSRNNHHAAAIAAEVAANEHYGDVDNLIMTVRANVEQFVGSLGRQDAVRFQAEADEVLTTAQQALDRTERALTTFITTLTAERPNPHELKLALGRIGNAVGRIEQTSERIDWDGDDYDLGDFAIDVAVGGLSTLAIDQILGG